MDTKTKILYAAAAEFAEKGYAGTTVRMICQRADVNVAAVNYHFESKEILYKSVFRFLFEKIEPDTTAALKSALSESDIRTSIREWVRCRVRMFIRPEPFTEYMLRITLREMTYPTEIFSYLYKEFLKPRLQMLEGSLSEWLPCGVELYKIYMFMFSMISQCLFYFQYSPFVRHVFGDEKQMTDERAEEVTDFITDGIFLHLNMLRNPQKK